MRRRIAVIAVLLQCILAAAHFAIYITAQHFLGPLPRPRIWAWALGLLSVSFVSASLLAFRSGQYLVRVFYKLAAVWLGLAQFLFLACIGVWLTAGLARLAHLPFNPRCIAFGWLAAGLAAGAYGLINAAWTRVTRVTVRLDRLLPQWHGRSLALISDLHLGDVRGAAFARRSARRLKALNPVMVLIGGDLFDGTPGDFTAMAAPLAELTAALPVYFIGGNHEGFRPRQAYFEAAGKAGVTVLNNEMVTLQGLQLVGIHYREAVQVETLRAALRQAIAAGNSPAACATILLVHAPDHVEVAAAEGIGLQLSGHTHGGQIWPFTLLARRVYRRFTYGLQRHGSMAVFTSFGAGTWGPPLRVGTKSEIVLIRLEAASPDSGR